MPLSSEDLYRLLGSLLAETPAGFTDGEFNDDTRRWVARAGALIEVIGDRVEIVKYRSCSDFFGWSDP